MSAQGAPKAEVEWNCFVPECVSYAVDEIAKIIVELVKLVRGMREAGLGEILSSTRVVYHFVEGLASVVPEGLCCLCEARRSDFGWVEIELDDSDGVVESKSIRLAKAIIEQSGVVHPHRTRAIRGIGLEFTLDGKEDILLHCCRWEPGPNGQANAEW